LAASKNAAPPRSVFTSAMEDAPSDDESASIATVSSSMNIPMKSAHIQKASPPPQALPKGLNSLKKPPVHAGQGPVTSEPRTVESSKIVPVTAAAEDMTPDDEGAALALDASSSKHDILPKALVESAPLNHQTSVANASPAHDNPFPFGSSSHAEQVLDSGTSVFASNPILKPVDASQSVQALPSIPSSPRNSSASSASRSVVRSGAAAAATAKAALEASAPPPPPPPVAAMTQSPLELAEPQFVDIADNVHVDLQRFAVSRRQVELFLDPDDVPLPPELLQLASSSELASKIDAGECCVFQFSCRCDRLSAVLSVDIAAAVQQIMVDASARAGTLSTILPPPVVMDVVDDKDCMSALLAALLDALDLVARCLTPAFPPMLVPQGTS